MEGREILIYHYSSSEFHLWKEVALRHFFEALIDVIGMGVLVGVRYTSTKKFEMESDLRDVRSLR